ncbi:uncharacterized protein (DUF1697 family) [Flavobacteriaceae bacterium MAR_2010_72]|nr:uncharacterized protein (DUF1697 family) [Flavobacteriaceae bacterium MAR_2010_72]TVZ57885.1 uncharacterized protein (DUF1697 family) [Flavobacteriaceae bacterium MAR_2010_105]
MKTYIALLRGINVSGQKKVPMAELRQLLTAKGLNEVQTYIQSGNVIFKSLEEDLQKLELTIHEAIKEGFGYEVPILIKTHNALQRIFEDCPFSEKIKQNSYFMLLFVSANKDLVKEISRLSYPEEKFYISNDCIYFHSSKGYGQSKFNNNFFERKLKVIATARNYKTMLKLLSLSAD